MEMPYFKNNFWGEKNAGFDILYHNMKHGQIATKELAEFVRERAAIEETYSKSMSKLAKIASNGSPLGTFAPMWDVFRVSSDKLALCHLELMRKMNDLIRDINKYSEEQVKIHRKTKEEMIGTLESVQSLQVQSTHLQKAREGYHSKWIELERLRKEGVPQKELEKAELKSKKAAGSFAGSIEKFNRAGRDFEQKMSESAQKFQDIEEAHLRRMKLLIKAYSHSIEDTHVQVGQVHEEFKQNVENIGIENLIQKFTDQKGTGKERPGPVGFEEYLSPLVSENSKKSRAKAFRIPGLGKKDKEPDSTDSAVADALNSPLKVDNEGFVIRADVNQNGCAAEEKEGNFNSSDSDFDDDEPKKFHIQIRPVASSNRSNSAANELELKATVGALTLPPNRAVSVKKQLSGNSSSAGRSEGEGESVPQRDGEQEGLRRSTSSPDHSRLSSTASGSDALFGPPLESAFKSHSFAGREQLQKAFAASEYAAFSSDSSSPENVEDSGLDSPSHQPLGASPEPTGWAAWPSTQSQSKDSVNLSRSCDPFLTAFSDPSLGRSPLPQDDPTKAWPSNLRSPRAPPDVEPTTFSFPAFSHSLPSSELEPSVWSCKHIPPEDPFLDAFERSAPKDNLPPPDAWALPPPRPTRDGRGMEVEKYNLGKYHTSHIDHFYVSQHGFRQDSTERLALAPPRSVRPKRSAGRLSGCERSRSLCSSPLPKPSPPLTSSSSSSPSEWGVQNRVPSPARGLSRGPSPISLSTQESWPVAAAITEYINAYFKGGEHNCCLVKITGDLTMSFPAGIIRIFTANPNAPVLSFRLVNISRVDHFLPNQKLLYSDPSQSDPDTKDFWFNMPALTLHLQREAELNPQASYYNVALLKYQVSSQDPGRAPLLLSAECQRSGTVTRVSLDYHCCPATAPASQLTSVQVLLPLDHTATDLQCQPPASWNAEERRLLWKLSNLSPTNHSKGSGTLCASWQCLEVPRSPPPSLAVQFVGSGASLAGLDVELVGSRYRMSLVKKRFATGKYMAGCSL
ncbi:F-BAR domain only protein 1-like [Sinocyclocheilus rhinocerous]|uniref:F-BAR domain only protein 1-like n=1 Tax=Sinocyclocheilus rhinocerous TaxID=307959 RepID=UPI0007B87192|nr:PREDICTED: F-BAR domain only protein 1-like [Sinocyclocheilus rhinocerous]